MNNGNVTPIASAAIQPSPLSFKGVAIHKMSKKHLIEVVTQLHEGAMRAIYSQRQAAAEIERLRAIYLQQRAAMEIERLRDELKSKESNLIVPDYVRDCNG